MYLDKNKRYSPVVIKSSCFMYSLSSCLICHFFPSLSRIKCMTRPFSDYLFS